MIRYLPVEKAHIRPLAALRVGPDQEKLVGANWLTLAEAPYEPGALVRGIWQGETPIGLFAMINPAESPPRGDDDIALDAGYLWRLMFDQTHQGRGHGGHALTEAARIARGWGHRALTLSVEQQPNAATPFYERHGFHATGRIIDSCIEMRRDFV